MFLKSEYIFWNYVSNAPLTTNVYCERKSAIHRQNRSNICDMERINQMPFITTEHYCVPLLSKILILSDWQI